MTIKIVLPEGNEPRAATGTRLFTESGEEIEGVSEIELLIASNCMLQAKITVCVSSIENINGLIPLLSDETVLALGQLGYKAVALTDEN